MSTNGNAFMATAQKSKREQANIERNKSEAEEYIVTNIRIPKSLHRRLQLHRVETGESMTQFIRRLLEAELR